jgi:hypothetical protein
MQRGNGSSHNRLKIWSGLTDEGALSTGLLKISTDLVFDELERTRGRCAPVDFQLDQRLRCLGRVIRPVAALSLSWGKDLVHHRVASGARVAAGNARRFRPPASSKANLPKRWSPNTS